MLVMRFEKIGYLFFQVVNDRDCSNKLILVA